MAVLEHMEVHKHIKAESRFAKVDESPSTSSAGACRRGRGTRGPHILICKGAVEEILSVCDRTERNGEAVPLEPVSSKYSSPQVASR